MYLQKRITLSHIYPLLFPALCEFDSTWLLCILCGERAFVSCGASRVSMLVQSSGGFLRTCLSANEATHRKSGVANKSSIRNREPPCWSPNDGEALHCTLQCFRRKWKFYASFSATPPMRNRFSVDARAETTQCGVNMRGQTIAAHQFDRQLHTQLFPQVDSIKIIY